MEYEYEYDYDMGNDGAESELTHDVIIGIVLVFGMISSVLLMLTPVALRNPRSPFLITLVSWAFANLFLLVVLASIELSDNSYTWTLGEFWCRGSYYLRRALLYTRDYLMVLACLVTAIGNGRLYRLMNPRGVAIIFAPFATSSVVWVMVFLPCIQYWKLVDFKQVGVVKRGYWCLFFLDSTFRIVELLAAYILPIALTIALLVIWAFQTNRSQTPDPREKIQAIILTVVMHLFLVGHLGQVVVTPFLTDSYSQLGEPVATARRVSRYLAIADYVISPVVCVLIIFLHRRRLSVSGNVKNSVADEEASDTGI